MAATKWTWTVKLTVTPHYYNEKCLQKFATSSVTSDCNQWQVATINCCQALKYSSLRLFLRVVKGVKRFRVDGKIPCVVGISRLYGSIRPI